MQCLLLTRAGPGWAQHLFVAPSVSGCADGFKVFSVVIECVHSPLLPLFLLSPAFTRDLEARAQNEFFRAFFRLPRQEKLHTVADCSLWTPFSRCHTVGRMFASDSYICFASKEDGCCNVILPLREVGTDPACLGDGTPAAVPTAGPCRLRMGVWREALPELDLYPFGCCFFSCCCGKLKFG